MPIIDTASLLFNSVFSAAIVDWTLSLLIQSKICNNLLGMLGGRGDILIKPPLSKGWY